MNWNGALGAAIAAACLAGCAGCESVDATTTEVVPEVISDAAPEAIPEVAPAAVSEASPAAVSEVAPEASSADATEDADPEEYRISVEIPVDDVTISRGENLDVDAMLDERTAFAATDFHLREIVLIARARRGGSAELLIDEWASGAVDIPLGDTGAWYEVRIPAADVGDAGVEWVVDFTGALDLNLLVAVLEPRSALLAAATATVREVVVEDEVPVDKSGVALADPSVEVVQAVEVVEPAATPSTVVQEVAIVEQPVYHTRTVYRYVDRPIYRYRVSWIYDPARYYVFRDYGGWTYRYFPGTWDWRYYNPSFRLPRHHHHRDNRRHRADRNDGRRFDRRDRDDHRGDRDRRRSDRGRDAGDRRDGNDRDRNRRGVRPDANDSRAVVSRPRALRRQVDPRHPRFQLATQSRSEPRVEDDRRTNPRLRASQGPVLPDGIRGTSRTEPANVRLGSFQRREARQVEPRATVTPAPTRASRNPRIANRTETSEPRQDGRNARTRAFQRRPEQRPPARTVSPRTTPARQRPTVREGGDPRQEAPRPTSRTRVFQRQTPRAAAPTPTRSVAPRQDRESRPTVPSTTNRQRSTVNDRGNARTRAFQRRPEPRVVEPPRPRTQPRVQSRPHTTTPVRSVPPVRSIPPRETSRPSSRPQRTAPSRNTPPRERPAQRAPAAPQKSDSGSDTPSDEGRRSNPRTRGFERR